MCGICGVSINTKEKENLSLATGMFRSLLAENTSRGKHSTGIVYLSSNKYQMVKGVLPGTEAQNFVHPSRDNTGFLGHTRFATVGNINNRKNIHPFETEHIIGVHNGTIFNYKHLKRQFELEPKGDCDSEIIFCLIDKLGIEGLKHVEGTYMLAYIYKDKPDIIHLFTNGSKPLLCIYIKDTLLAFGSEANRTKKVLKQSDNKKVLNKIVTATLKPCILYKIQQSNIIDYKSYIKIIPVITEKQGELMYKIGFKILNFEKYMETIPESRRLPAPIKPKIDPVTTKPHYNKYRSEYYRSQNDINITKADTQTLLWYRNLTDNLFKMFRNNFYIKNPQQIHAFIDIDVFASEIKFASQELLRSFIWKNILGNTSDDPKVATNIDPWIAGVLPYEKTPSKLYFPYSLMATTLFLVLTMADRVTLYKKKYSMYSDENTEESIKAKDFMAALTVSLLHRGAARDAANEYKKAFVDTGVIDENVFIADTMEKRKILDAMMYENVNTLKKHVVVFNTSCQFISKYSLGLLANSYITDVYNANTAINNKLRSHIFTVDDLAIYGRAYIFMVILDSMIEAIYNNCPTKYIYKRVGDVTYANGNKFEDLITKLFEKYYSDAPGDFECLTTLLSDLKDLVKFNNIKNISAKSEIECIELAYKEYIWKYFGKISLYNHRYVNEIFNVVHKMNNEEITTEFIRRLVFRYKMLRNFTIKNEYSEPTGIETLASIFDYSQLKFS